MTKILAPTYRKPKLKYIIGPAAKFVPQCRAFFIKGRLAMAGPPPMVTASLASHLVAAGEEGLPDQAMAVAGNQSGA